jgi:hypothetical protein
MTGQMPPIPPENRSRRGTGDTGAAPSDDPHALDTTPNPDKKGHQANIKVNTTHQGYQQDR